MGFSQPGLCFARRQRNDTERPAFDPIGLAPETAAALGDLVDILTCGEESAAMVFDLLARRAAFGGEARQRLRQIAADEARHDVWLSAMRVKLGSQSKSPPATPRAFFASLDAGGL